MAVSSICVMSNFFVRSHTLVLSKIRSYYRLSLHTVLPIVAIGAAPSLVNAAACFINVIINKSLYAHGGDIAVGAAGIFSSYTSLMTMVVVGLCQGMQPIIGYNYGAGMFHRLKRTYWMAVGMATAIVVAGMVFGLSAPGMIARAFTTDPGLIGETVRCLSISLLCFGVVGFQVVSTTLFQSLGRAGASIFLSLTRQVIFLIPALLILPTRYGLDGVWASFPVSDMFATAVTAGMIWWQLREINRLAATSAGKPLENPESII